MKPHDLWDAGEARPRRAGRVSERRRQAGRLVDRAAWLSHEPVAWAGDPAEVPRIAGAPPSLQAILQDRLAAMPPGLYAVRLEVRGAEAAGRPSPGRREESPPSSPAAGHLALDLVVTAVTAMTPERMSDASRAVEGTRRYPRAVPRLVGEAEPWREAMRALLARHRCAAVAFEGWKARETAARGGGHRRGRQRGTAPAQPEDGQALVAEARSLWLGSRPPPSATLPESVLARWTGAPVGDDDDVACVAAVALGRRNRRQRCHRGRSSWAELGRTLERWAPGTLVRLGRPAGPAVVAALAQGAPGLNDPLAAAWADERTLDPRPLTVAEIGDLSRLLREIGAATDVLRDPARAAALVAATVRLGRLSGRPAEGALAGWLEACRPLERPDSLWQAAIVPVASGREPSHRDRARAMLDSLAAHAPALAAAMASAAGNRAESVRAILPVALARGPDACRQVIERELWHPDADALDAALRFHSAIQRSSRPLPPGSASPVSNWVVSCPDPCLRDALLDFGLAAWVCGAAEAEDIAAILDRIRLVAGQPGAPPWARVLPALRQTGLELLRHGADRSHPSAAPHPGTTASLASMALGRCRHFAVLDVCARWAEAGFPAVRRLARVLSRRWPSIQAAAHEWDPDDHDHDNLLVRLSEGRVGRFLALLRLPRAPRRRPWRGLDGLGLVEGDPLALQWVSAALARPELVPRVVALLERLGLVARLEPGLRLGPLLEPLGRPAEPPPALPAWVGEEERATLREIHGAAALAGLPEPLPKGLQRILRGGEGMERERATLRARAAGRPLSAREAIRLERLERIRAEPGAGDAELRHALARALPRQRALVGLTALETLTAGLFRRRWRGVLRSDSVPAGADWDNALLMMDTVRANRRVLKRLLRHAVRGEHTWFLDLEPNRAFLERLRSVGLHPDEWLARRSRTLVLPGEAWSAFVATDPLEVLQMGSLFGTCLSADQINAHAAVAAAVEVNKRVLFVRDARGRVLGRQLLAITAAGEIIGFTCYGGGRDGSQVAGHRVRLALALLALEVARSAGAQLIPGARLAQGLTPEEEQGLFLFCQGYLDAPEPFDWWIEELAVFPGGSQEEDRERVRAMLQDLPPRVGERYPWGPAQWLQDQLAGEDLRARIWLDRE